MWLGNSRNLKCNQSEFAGSSGAGEPPVKTMLILALSVT